MSQREIELETENARLKRWIDNLQSGMYINCVYCGHRYGPNQSTPASMADVLKAHIAECPAHPMSRLLKACKGAYHALSSILADREGITDELLTDIRDACDNAVKSAAPK